MAASDQTILDNAKDALSRILSGDVSAASEGVRQMTMLDIPDLRDLINEYTRKTQGSAGRRLFHPVIRIDH